MNSMVDGMMARHTDNQTIDMVLAELGRQILLWGVQSHPDHTGPGWNLAGHAVADGYNEGQELATAFKQINDRHVGNDTLSWSTILQEEMYEALAESDRDALVTELVQVAAVAVAWVRDLVNREVAA